MSLALVVGMVCLSALRVGAEELEITYLANEGFLLRSGESAVLIDALFAGGIRGYPALAESERALLEAADPPYDDVDLVLASHYHPDHFNAEAMKRYLAANPRAFFVSTKQAVGNLLKIAPEVEDRVRGIYPGEGSTEVLEVSGFDLKVFNLHHGRGGPELQNLGLLVEICGATVLHIGDTEANRADLHAAGLQDLEPDVALIPDWFLRGKRWAGAVEDIIDPGRIVAMHLPSEDAPASYFYDGAGDLEGVARAIHARHPNAFVPLRTGESITVPCL